MGQQTDYQNKVLPKIVYLTNLGRNYQQDRVLNKQNQNIQNNLNIVKTWGRMLMEMKVKTSSLAVTNSNHRGRQTNQDWKVWDCHLKVKMKNRFFILNSLGIDGIEPCVELSSQSCSRHISDIIAHSRGVCVPLPPALTSVPNIFPLNAKFHPFCGFWSHTGKTWCVILIKKSIPVCNNAVKLLSFGTERLHTNHQCNYIQQYSTAISLPAQNYII